MMKISEMIAHLEKLKEEHGDLACYFWGHDSYYPTLFDECHMPEFCKNLGLNEESVSGIIFG